MDIARDPAPSHATVLLVGADPDLLQELTRLAAAAGVVPDIVADPVAALASWSRAGVVLVAADCLPRMAALRPSRRPGVHVVTREAAAPGCWRDALALGAESVAELPTTEGWLVEVLTDAGDGAGRAGTTIGVVAGSGGAGASVFAAALAEWLGRERSVLLVDADPLGAGQDRILGMEDSAGIRWDALARSTGRLSGRSMRDALPHRNGLGVLAWPAEGLVALQAPAMREVLSAGARGFATVVVDLPRHPDPVVDEAASRCDHLVVVVPAGVGGVAAATRVVRRLPPSTPRHLLVRTRRGGVPAEEIGRVLDTPVLATLGEERGLAEALDLGAGPLRSARGPLARACRAVGSALCGEQS